MKAPPEAQPRLKKQIVPKTPKEKWDNFWFQYKWHVTAIVAVTVILAVLITQCATPQRVPILRVVYFTYTAALDEQTDKNNEYIEKNNASGY